MENCNKENMRTTAGELDIASKILSTVKKQIEHYSLSLQKVILLRSELLIDKGLAARASKSPESLAELFIERGVPSALAYGMAAEDHGHFGDMDKSLALWTWSCCCTQCCITCIGTTNVNAIAYTKDEKTL